MSELTLITALQQLVTENTVISSRFSKNQQRYLDDLAKTGLIKLSRQGRGFVYQVINIDALQNHLKQLQPLNESELSSDLPQRSRNIGLYKNSKQQNAEHEVYYLLLKAVGDAVYWSNETKFINVSEQTYIQGVSSLMIQVADNWQSQIPLFLVENQALFNRLDWLPTDFNGSVVYYSGNIPTILLDWLAYKTRATQLILFADYDGIGLSNYLRLCVAVKNQQSCNFYLMPNWQEKLTLFGNSVIWKDNQTVFHNAVKNLHEINALSDELKHLTTTMQSLGKALEQEVIWLNIL